MKYKLALFILSSAGLNAQSFIGNTTPSAGDTGVFAYWNFNSLSISTASAPGSGGVPTSISSNFGTANLSLTGWTGTVDDFAGSTLNAQLSSPSEESLSLVRSTNGNGGFIQFSFSMANLKDLTVSFATRGTSSGFTTGTWSYSSNGTTFTSFGASTATTSTSFAVATPGSTVTQLNNLSNVFLRYTLSGSTDVSGNNRIDNISLSATAIPEPSTFAALLGLTALAGAATRRRRVAA